MKRFHYSEEGEQDISQKLELGKQEEQQLPDFAKEVPTSSKKSEKDGNVRISYSWKKSTSPVLRVKSIEFRKGENLDQTFRAGARDGADSMKVVRGDVVYILRKTALEIAQALFKAASRMTGNLESIVGYLRSVGGNDYVISRVDGEAWTFDKRIAGAPFHYLELESMDGTARKKLGQMIVESLARIHASNFIMGRFSLSNVLILGEGISMTDLRKLRVSRKKGFVADEFRNAMQYLFALGVVSEEDIFQLVASYEALNPESCREWFRMQEGRDPEDDFEVASRLEENLFD
jgi:hypothetical protein